MGRSVRLRTHLCEIFEAPNLVFMSARPIKPKLASDAKVASALPLCASCIRGPVGIAGHEDLFSHTMDASQIQFKCRACGHVWTRLYKGAGVLEWAEPSGRSPGPALPGRRMS